MQEEKVEVADPEMQKAPKISFISSEVAKTLPGRAGGGNFLKFSEEWAKQKDGKLK